MALCKYVQKQRKQKTVMEINSSVKLWLGNECRADATLLALSYAIKIETGEWSMIMSMLQSQTLKFGFCIERGQREKAFLVYIGPLASPGF